MKKVYVDMTENNNCVSIFLKNTDVIQTGTTIYSMPVTDNNTEYQKIADEHDVHFIFDDNIPRIDFYTIPFLNIMAIDSDGGYFCTVGEISDLDSNAPICYIDRCRKAFFIADNFKIFLDKIASWKSELQPYDKIQFFPSKEEAHKMYEFFDVNTLKSCPAWNRSSPAETASKE